MKQLIEKPTNLPENAPERLNHPDFYQLSEVPPEFEWFANIRNPETKRAYQNDVKSFCAFIGINQPQQFREVTRAHVIAWRDDLDQQQLSASTVRRKRVCNLNCVNADFFHLKLLWAFRIVCWGSLPQTPQVFIDK